MQTRKYIEADSDHLTLVAISDDITKSQDGAIY